MGRITSLKDLIGAIKDKASQTKAAIKTPTSKSHHHSLLRATTHDLFNPPNPKHLSNLLSSAGEGSRATAAAAIDSLMYRLQTTHDSSVALKCLIVVHSIVKHGSFILQDQLSVYPSSSGGRNYLKLSNFRDGWNPVSWEHSCWVRWYARYLELLIYTSKVIGSFLGPNPNRSSSDSVSAMVTADLVKETDSLVGLIEEIGKKPESLHLKENLLTAEIADLVGEDFLSAVNEVCVRIGEFKHHHRVSSLRFGESVELVCVLKRLLGCREKLVVLWWRKRVLIDEMWVAAGEVLDAAEKKSGGGSDGGGRLMLTWGRSRRRSDMQGTESARFGGRVVSCSDSVKVSSSARFGSNRYIHLD